MSHSNADGRAASFLSCFSGLDDDESKTGDKRSSHEYTSADFDLGDVDMAPSKWSFSSPLVQATLNELKQRDEQLLRVKLYVAQPGCTEKWMEQEVGLADVVEEADEQYHLILRRENSTQENEERLVNAALSQCDSFSLRGTVIHWRHGYLSYAFSFSSEDSCRAFWNVLLLLAPDRVGEELEEDEPENGSDYGHANGVYNEAAEEFRYEEESYYQQEPVSAPPPPQSAQDVVNIIKRLRSFGKPEFIIRHGPRWLEEMTEPVWLNALWGILNERRNMLDKTACGVIADLLSLLVAMYAATSNPFASLALTPSSEQRFLDPMDPLVRLLSDEHYLYFFQAMFFETELQRHPSKPQHTDFIRKAEFHDIICKGDLSYRLTSTFIFRLLYLRDVCLPRLLDEMSIQRLTLVINSGYAYICRMIQLTPDTLIGLKQLIPHDVQAGRCLLSLLTSLRANTAATAERNHLYFTLKQENVLAALEGYITGDCPLAAEWPRIRAEQIKQKNEETRKIEEHMESGEKHHPDLLSHARLSVPTLPELAIEIFNLTAEQNASLVRHALWSCVDERRVPHLWLALCDLFRDSDNEGLHIQLTEIFRKVLDPATLEESERDDLLALFYDKGVVDKLVEVVLTDPPATFDDLRPSADGSCKYFLAEMDADEDVTPTDRTSIESDALSDPQGTENESLTRRVTEPAIVDRPTAIPIYPPGTSEDPNDQSLLHPAKRRASTGQSNFQGEPDSYRTESAKQPAHNSSDASTHYTQHRRSCHKKFFDREISDVQKEEILYAARSQLVFSKCQIYEILTFCVAKHCARIKYKSLRLQLHLRLISSACSPVFNQFQALYAIKFLKVCLLAEADHYSKLFKKQDVLAPVFHILLHCVPRPQCRSDGSILESAILELFTMISVGAQAVPPVAHSHVNPVAMCNLLRYIMEQHGTEIQELHDIYSKVSFLLFEQIKVQYNQLVKQSSRWQRNAVGDVRDSIGSQKSNRSERGWSGSGITRQIDEAERERLEEEQYFESDSDEVTETERELEFKEFIQSAQSSPLSPLSSLVPADEEDDEEVPDYLKQFTPGSRRFSESPAPPNKKAFGLKNFVISFSSKSEEKSPESPSIQSSKQSESNLQDAQDVQPSIS